MNERAALMRAVCENPDDDTPRLVFADWFQEHGDESDRARAEFIRLQCRRERGAATTLDEWSSELSREMAILKAHGDRWQAELPASEAPELQWQCFERGFVGEMLSVNARMGTEPNSATIRWEGTDCSRLDWNRIYWSGPFVRFYFFHLSNWQTPLCLPEAARLKSVCLVGCEIDEASLQTLLHWGESCTGNLVIRQDEFDSESEARLRAAFGERFCRKSYLGDY